MKKGKLLFLLLAILSLAILFASCDGAAVEDSSDTSNESQSGTENGSGSGSEALVSETASTEIAELESEQENSTHEMHSYFDLRVEEEVGAFESISRIDGNLIGNDNKNDLAIVEDEYIDTMNNLVRTVKVYDLFTGEVIREDSVKGPYGETPVDGTVTLDVDIFYPLIRVCKMSYAEKDEGEDPEPTYEISYYLACKDGELVHTTNRSAVDINTDVPEMGKYHNGLVWFKASDKYIWIDKELNVIRSVDAILENNNDFGLDEDSFDSEYKGYLYSWTDSSLMIFNHAGLVSGKYMADDDSTISCFVLDNGNVLIQQFTDVGAYGSCDFVLQGTRYTMKSMIMDLTSGSITDIALDFAVDDIESEYEQESGTNWVPLAGGRDNMAVVYKIANGTISSYADIYVLDNDCNVVYTVVNNTEGVDLSQGIEPVAYNRYAAYMQKDGYSWKALFDLDGNFISAYTDGFAGNYTDTYVKNMYVTNKYIVSENAIYDYKMEIVFDIAANGYELYCCADNKIYLHKNNFKTGGVETYRFTGSGSAPALVADGIDFIFRQICGELYSIYDVENGIQRVYNNAGDELLVSAENVNVTVCDNVILLSTRFNSEYVIYTVK